VSQRLFDGGKIGCFVDDYGPGIEKRRGGEVAVLAVTFRVQPFDAKLATSLDSGVGEDSNIRPTVFSLNTAEPKPHFTRHDFKLGLTRQNLEIFASTDTDKSRVSLLQAKISGTYVRTQKDMNALAFVFKATFGPVGREELELIHSLHRSQAFIRFHEAEPLLDMETEEDGEDEEGTDADVKAQRPAPMWDDNEPAEKAADKPAKKKPERAHRPLHSHQAKKGMKRKSARAR
jgi:hypothetical protein